MKDHLARYRNDVWLLHGHIIPRHIGPRYKTPTHDWGPEVSDRTFYRSFCHRNTNYNPNHAKVLLHCQTPIIPPSLSLLRMGIKRNYLSGY
jgi:hypothetical protein